MLMPISPSCSIPPRAYQPPRPSPAGSIINHNGTRSEFAIQLQHQNNSSGLPSRDSVETGERDVLLNWGGYVILSGLSDPG
jgi:hypothetical protein